MALNDMPSAPFGFSPPTFEGSISNYTPPLRDQAAYWLARNWFGDNREGVEKAKRLTNIAEYTPFGFATMADDTTRDVGRGDYLGAGINLAMAAIPGPTPKGIRAYHGSPHSFDKFSMDKIGTGEGAQAYGHGLYFAENEGVAKNYRDNLSKAISGVQIDGVPLEESGLSKAAQGIAKMHAEGFATVESRLASDMKALERANELLAKNPDSQVGQMNKVMAELGIEAANSLKGRKIGYKPHPGHMYEVQINADPDQFLDWDKPLSEQPESVRTYFGGDPEFNAVVSKNPGNPFYNVPLRSPPTGAEVWRKIVGTDDPVKRRQSAQGAAKKLAEMGIPGIKYLDQGSRAKGDGSRNYVVFDDSLINILRKYGIALPFAGAALGNIPFSLSPPQEQQQ